VCWCVHVYVCAYLAGIGQRCARPSSSCYVLLSEEVDMHACTHVCIHVDACGYTRKGAPLRYVYMHAYYA
jgi:hypothetical protein